jgi:hypothetical protein
MPHSENPSSKLDRRKFLKTAATTAGVMFIKPSLVGRPCARRLPPSITRGARPSSSRQGTRVTCAMLAAVWTDCSWVGLDVEQSQAKADSSGSSALGMTVVGWSAHCIICSSKLEG